MSSARPQHTDTLNSTSHRTSQLVSTNRVSPCVSSSSVIVVVNKSCGATNCASISTQASSQNRRHPSLKPSSRPSLQTTTVDGDPSDQYHNSLSRLPSLEGVSILGSITRTYIMSSTSPLSPGSHSPNSPVSSKSVPSTDGYFNPPRPENPRLESITEHIKADHAQRPRASSAASISFRPPPSKTSQTLTGTVRSRPRSLIRDASPPPAR
jgi:hypothetical protein